MDRGFTMSFAGSALCLALLMLALPACSRQADAPAASSHSGGEAPATAGVRYASLTGDPTKGRTAFATCSACHALEAGLNRIGPSLHGVVGRRAGSVPGYSYSPANRESGITWTEEQLFQFLERPQRVMPGTKMVFPGWSDAEKRADVIAYLKQNS